MANSTSRPKSVYFLLAVFIWSALKSMELLQRGPTSADRLLFDYAGLTWLFFAIVPTIMILDIAAAWFLIKPRHLGTHVCIASISASALETLIAFIIARSDAEVATRAYTVSRESRGLPVREDALRWMVDPTISTLLLIGSLLVSVVLARIALKNRDYFTGGTGRTL